MSTPELSGPPAPGTTEPGPFSKTHAAVPNVAGAHSPGAWKTLTDAIGKNLQGGMWRAEQSRRRLGRLR